MLNRLHVSDADLRPPRCIDPFVTLAGLTVVLGLTARLVHLDFPRTFSFDEHHFVENARNYLHHRPDWNDHPPLGKLTIALGVQSFGDTPIAWRLSSLIAGFSTVVLGGLLARRVFESPLGGLLAAALLAADGFFIAYSKTAVLDGQLTALALAAAYVAFGPPSVFRFIFAGVLAGLAASVKMSGVAALLPIAFAGATLARGRATFLIGIAALAFGSAYFSNWWVGLKLSGHDFSLRAPYEETLRLLKHHAILNKAEHPLNTSWPEWFILKKPITLARTTDQGLVRVLSSLGNPLLWVSVSLVTLGTLGLSFWLGAKNVLERALRESDPSGGYITERGRGALFLLSGFLAFLLPWMLSRRDPYLYHYLPSYAFGLVILAGLVDWLRTRYRRLALVFLASVFVVTAFYFPVWTGMPLHESGVVARLFVPGWR